jgi:hypothetical protein
LKTDTWSDNKRKSLLGDQVEKAAKKKTNKGTEEVKGPSTSTRTKTKQKKKRSSLTKLTKKGTEQVKGPSTKTKKKTATTASATSSAGIEDDGHVSVLSSDDDEKKVDPFLSMFSSSMTTIFKDMVGVSEKKAIIEASIERSQLQREANAEKLRVLAQIENFVDKLSNPNLNLAGKEVIEKFLTSSMLLLQSLDQQAQPMMQPTAAQYSTPAWHQPMTTPGVQPMTTPGVQAQPMMQPAAAQYSPPAWHQPMTTPVQLFGSARQTRDEVAAVVPEVTPASEASI